MLGKADKNVNTDEGSEMSILVSSDGGTTWVAAKCDDEGRLIFKSTDSDGDVINPATEDKQDDVITELQKMTGLEIPAYDYVSVAYADTTDTYTFKSGGVGGDTVATVTITYTDDTKVDISTVAKT